VGISLFVDRITDGIASLVCGDGEYTVDFPLRALPGGTKEGDWLRVSFSADEEKKKRVAEEIDSLMDELEK
jgi:hypothetical protein